jgi:hypothetical protein
MTFRLPFRVFLLSTLAGLTLPGIAAAQFSSSSYYHIKPRHAVQAGYDLCLDVELDAQGAGSWDNARIQQYTCNPSWPQDNQLWSLIPAGTNIYRLVPASSAKCLDVLIDPLNPPNGNGRPLQQWTCNLAGNQTNQVFEVSAAVTPGYYRIKSINWGGTHCLDVPMSGGNYQYTPGLDIQQWACGPWWMANQDFQIVVATNRSPKGHIQYFGYYGEADLYSSPGIADDQQNMIVYTAATLPMIDIRPAHITAKLALTDLIVNKPRHADTGCQPNQTPAQCDPTGLFANHSYDGGLRPDICSHWAGQRAGLNTNARITRIKAFYIDEPFWNLHSTGWSDGDATTIVRTVAQVVKGTSSYCGPTNDTQAQSIPLATVENLDTLHLQAQPEIDWVGFTCHEDLTNCNGDYPGTPNYLTEWNRQRSLLLPHQKIVAVAPGRVDVPTAQNPSPCDIPHAIATVDDGEEWLETTRADFRLALALAEPKTAALWVWHGPSRYANPNVPPCTQEGVTVGTFDLPIVNMKWRFLSRAIGFGNP